MKRIAIAALLILAGAAACNGNDYSAPTTPPPPPPPPPTGSAAVTILDNAYSPSTVTIGVGQAVVWTNVGSSPHNVTADGGTFSSGTIAAKAPGYSGGVYTHVFSTAGTFAYHCTIHAGMTGMIVVSAPNTP